MNDKTRQVLLGAKAEISNGWIQGKVLTNDGVCLYGALIRASGIAPRALCTPSPASDVKGRSEHLGAPTYVLTDDSDLWEAVKVLADTLGIEYREMALWNDAPGRTATEVVDLIDRVLSTDAPSDLRELTAVGQP